MGDVRKALAGATPAGETGLGARLGGRRARVANRSRDPGTGLALDEVRVHGPRVLAQGLASSLGIDRGTETPRSSGQGMARFPAGPAQRRKPDLAHAVVDRARRRDAPAVGRGLSWRDERP